MGGNEFAAELAQALALSQEQADEREAAEEWAAAVEAAEAADVEVAAPLPAAPHVAECVVCMDAPQSHALVPCGHMCMCATCAERCVETVKECPMCRAPAHQTFRIYQIEV